MWFNPIMEWILKSPFHGIISNTTMIIYYTGCKSGRGYHTPVGYQRIDNMLLTTSWKNRTWWKNFRDACEVKILLNGKLVKGHTQVFEDDVSVSEGIKRIVSSNPNAARMFKIGLHTDGQVDPESLQKAASTMVIIQTALK